MKCVTSKAWAKLWSSTYLIIVGFIYGHRGLGVVVHVAVHAAHLCLQAGLSLQGWTGHDIKIGNVLAVNFQNT